MKLARSHTKPLDCLRDLAAYIRKEKQESEYSREVRVLRFAYDGSLIARETHVRQTNDGRKRPERRNPSAKAESLLNTFLMPMNVREPQPIDQRP